jgi:hypothetical protein
VKNSSLSRWNPGAAWLTLVVLGSAAALSGQTWDLGGMAGDYLSAHSENKLKLGVEQRMRFETRTGNAFGKDPDIDTSLIRTRLSLTWQPVKRLKFSVMAQDSRAPWYGQNAPNTIRDPFDLHEAYVQLDPAGKSGFGFGAGRMMLNYGEGRLIGTPQWSNLSRTYDHARLFYATPRARFEFLAVSPVKVRIGEFNRPVPGDRIWGTYNTFPKFWKKAAAEIYILRHEQNRPGGFTGGTKAAGTDRQTTETYGFRVSGPIAAAGKFNLEAAGQTGKIAAAHHQAFGFVGSLGRRWTIAKKPFDLLGEYKFASGARNPQDPAESRTFDQLYASNHDRFGHQDLFGWRNIHNLRALATWALSKSVAANFMYDDYWLASATDSLYNGSGKAIARSAKGTAGKHVGRETDLFLTYKFRRMTWGAGYGHLFTGGFLRQTTPGVGSSYAYIFQTYSL